MSPFLAELIGTMFIILLGNGVVANVLLAKSKGQNGGWIVITFGWAIAVFVGVYSSATVSGAHLNPAISIALAAIGKFEWALVPSYILAQLLGAMTGSFLMWLAYKKHFDEVNDADAMMAIFCTAPAIRNTVANLATEIIGTFVLIFVIFYITGGEIGEEKTPIGLGSVGALPVAFLVWVIGLSLGGTTGYAINPARDLGPRIIHSIIPMKGKGNSNWSYAWVPIAGPIIGASLAALLHLFLKD